MQKLYTVEDIANMTMMTSRTIRNYLKEGILKGKKIGGQWRFTEEDIRRFLDNGALKAEHFSNLKQDILDFIDGVNDFVRGEAQACAIVDLYQPVDAVDAKLVAMTAFLERHGGTPDNWMSVSSERIEAEGKTRVVIFAQPQYMADMMKILA